MPDTTCHACGSPITWIWEDAFDKFGFGDGDGAVMTDAVIAVLKAAGYEPTSTRWCLHKTIIDSITRDGVELIPPGTNIGYDDPRSYLPDHIVRLLDCKLPEREAVA